MAALSLAMMTGDTAAGATMPVNDADTKPGMVRPGGPVRNTDTAGTARDREHPDLPGQHQRQRYGAILQRQRDLTGNNILDRAAAALVGNVDDVKAGALVEHFADHVGRRSDPGRRIAEPAGVSFAVRNQLGDGLDRQCRVDHHDIGGGADQRHQGESAGGIVVSDGRRQG